jgi:chromate reductase
LLIVTPEYNRSLPAALKNAIDWASRPRGENSLAGKPSAMIGASSGAIGTAIAQQHLRSILGFCNSPLMSAVEGYLQLTPDGFTDDGDLRNHSTAEFLAGFMVEFHDFIDRLLQDRSAYSS